MSVIVYRVFLSDGTFDDVALEHVRNYINNSFRNIRVRGKVKITKIVVYCECSESFPLQMNREECEYLMSVMKHYVRYLNTLRSLVPEDVVLDVDEKARLFNANLKMKLRLFDKFDKGMNRCSK